MNPDYVEIGRRVRAARKSAGLTQKQVGEALNITAQAVSLVEAGTSRWPVDRLVDLGAVVGLTVTFHVAPVGDERADIVHRLSAIVDDLDPQVVATLQSLMTLWEAQLSTGAL